MIKFIKNLLGFDAEETIREILTPTAPYKIEPAQEWTSIEIQVNKVKPAISEGKTKGGTGVIKKTRRPHRKPKAPASPTIKSVQPAKPITKSKPPRK